MRSTDRGRYLDRRAARLRLAEIERRIVTGLGLGWTLLLVFGYRLLFVAEASDACAGAGAVLGGLLLALALGFPDALAPLERLSRWFGQTMGRWLLQAILVALYFAVLTPVGLILQRQKASAQEGWQVVRPVSESGSPGGRRTTARVALGIIAFFLERRRMVFVPLLIVLVLLGLVLAFVQTSVLAPLIYPLF